MILGGIIVAVGVFLVLFILNNGGGDIKHKNINEIERNGGNLTDKDIIQFISKISLSDITSSKYFLKHSFIITIGDIEIFFRREPFYYERYSRFDDSYFSITQKRECKSPRNIRLACGEPSTAVATALNNLMVSYQLYLNKNDSILQEAISTFKNKTLVKEE